MKKYFYFLILFLYSLIFSVFAAESKEKSFLILDPDRISSYKLDRIVYQRYEKKIDPRKDNFVENNTIEKDNSIENLLIIKDRKIHFISDGYDHIPDIKQTKFIKDTVNKYVEDNDFWINKINGKPDHIRIIYRRNNIMTNSSEQFVTENFGSFYKSVRDRFIKMHVEKYRHLINNKSESNFNVKKESIFFKINADNSNEITQKFSISAKAKANDGTVFFCEDADGDGITETFTATRDDGFHWGLNSGPNILFIKGNSDKEIESFIGKLAAESDKGTADQEKNTIKQFPNEKDVMNLMEQLTPSDKFYE